MEDPEVTPLESESGFPHLHPSALCTEEQADACPIPNCIWDFQRNQPLPIYGYFGGAEVVDSSEYLNFAKLLEGQGFDQQAHLDHIDYCNLQSRLKELPRLQQLLCSTQHAVIAQVPHQEMEGLSADEAMELASCRREELLLLLNHWADYWMLHTPFAPSGRYPFWNPQEGETTNEQSEEEPDQTHEVVDGMDE